MLLESRHLTVQPAAHQAAFPSERGLGQPYLSLLTREGRTNVCQPGFLLCRGLSQELETRGKQTASRAAQNPGAKSKFFGGSMCCELMSSIVQNARVDAVQMFPLVPCNVEEFGDQVGSPAEARVFLTK